MRACSVNFAQSQPSLKVHMNLQATLIACPEGGFTSFCPQIKGAISQGETEEEALANLVEAIEGLMEINAEISAEFARECLSELKEEPEHVRRMDFALTVA